MNKLLYLYWVYCEITRAVFFRKSPYCFWFPKTRNSNLKCSEASGESSCLVFWAWTRLACTLGIRVPGSQLVVFHALFYMVKSRLISLLLLFNIIFLYICYLQQTFCLLDILLPVHIGSQKREIKNNKYGYSRQQSVLI